MNGVGRPHTVFCSWVVGWVIKTFPKEAELPMGVTVTRGLYRERFLTQPWGGGAQCVGPKKKMSMA